VTSDERDVVLSQNFETAAHNLGEYGKIDALFGKAGYSKRRDWSASHCPHVIDRIERGYSTVIERVIYDGREEIDGLHKGEIVTETVYSCVVGGLEPDDEIRIEWLFW